MWGIRNFMIQVRGWVGVVVSLGPTLARAKGGRGLEGGHRGMQGLPPP